MSIINVKENYLSSVKDLQQKLEVSNVWALPRITKVSVNVGLGQNRANKDMVSYIQDTLTTITGQKVVPTKAKKAIAGFKIREGDVVGMRVTLRGGRMNDFLNRLINISLPRIRDFKGIDKKLFDKQGNLTIGLRDQIPFAELGHDAMEKQFGMTITITIKNSNPEKSFTLLQTLGFPMRIQ